MGLGRPRAINIEECTVKAPSKEDFSVVDARCHLFIAHVSISRHMGDIAESHRKRGLTDDLRQTYENVLFRWIYRLPQPLRLFTNQPLKGLADRHLTNLQLHVSYFVCLLMLYKDANSESPEFTAALLAASFIVGILEDIMARDEVRYLPAIFPFYTLAAGLVGLLGYRYPDLRSIAEQEFAVVKIVLEQLGQRWLSAKSALVALRNTREMIQKQHILNTEPKPLTASLGDFFEAFGPELCRCWHLQFTHSSVHPADTNEDLLRRPDLSGLTGQWEDRTTAESQGLIPDLGGQDYVLPEQSPLPLDDALPPVGSWLFDDIIFTDHTNLH